jgi:hypothetical protein
MSSATVKTNHIYNGLYLVLADHFPAYRTKSNLFDVPGFAKAMGIEDAADGREWLDADDYDRKLALAAPENLGGYDIDVAQLDITAAVETAARTNEFHPIRDKLQAASWDGTKRAESMFIDYFGVEDHP